MLVYHSYWYNYWGQVSFDPNFLRSNSCLALERFWNIENDSCKIINTELIIEVATYYVDFQGEMQQKCLVVNGQYYYDTII